MGDCTGLDSGVRLPDRWLCHAALIFMCCFVMLPWAGSARASVGVIPPQAYVEMFWLCGSTFIEIAKRTSVRSIECRIDKAALYDERFCSFDDFIVHEFFYDRLRKSHIAKSDAWIHDLRSGHGGLIGTLLEVGSDSLLRNPSYLIGVGSGEYVNVGCKSPRWFSPRVLVENVDIGRLPGFQGTVDIRICWPDPGSFLRNKSFLSSVCRSHSGICRLFGKFQRLPSITGLLNGGLFRISDDGLGEVREPVRLYACKYGGPQCQGENNQSRDIDPAWLIACFGTGLGMFGIIIALRSKERGPWWFGFGAGLMLIGFFIGSFSGSIARHLAAPNRSSKNVRIQTIVVAELEFRDV